MSEEIKVEKLQWVKGDKQGNVEIVKEKDPLVKSEWQISELQNEQ